MVSQWNLFVKKIYHDGRSKNKSYSFKQALKDASRRKKEMKALPSSSKKQHSKKGGKTRRVHR